jgi:OsmC-like protein
MDESFPVVVSAGSLRSPAGDAVQFSHRWTEHGVTLAAPFTGAHLLHAAVAGCVLNDLFREAAGVGFALDGVRVSASGGFTDRWESTGIDYQVEVDSPASSADLDSLLQRVDALAEIPRAIRAGVAVRRVT